MAKGPDIRAGLHFKGGTASVPARREILRLLRDGRHTAGEIAANFQPATGIDRAKFARVRESVILCSGMVRGLTELQYEPLKSWTRSRRVIAKAEVLQDKDNPRFIVGNLPAKGFDRIRTRLIASVRKSVMNCFTVRGVTWKTRSSNSIWTWKPIAPALTGWRAISCACGSAPLPCC